MRCHRRMCLLELRNQVYVYNRKILPRFWYRFHPLIQLSYDMSDPQLCEACATHGPNHQRDGEEILKRQIKQCYSTHRVPNVDDLYPTKVASWVLHQNCRNSCWKPAIKIFRSGQCWGFSLLTVFCFVFSVMFVSNILFKHYFFSLVYIWQI